LAEGNKQGGESETNKEKFVVILLILNALAGKTTDVEKIKEIFEKFQGPTRPVEHHFRKEGTRTRTHMTRLEITEVEEGSILRGSFPQN